MAIPPATKVMGILATDFMKPKQLIQINAFLFRSLDMMKRNWRWELVWIIYDITWALSTGFIGLGVNAVTKGNIDSSYLTLYLLIGTLIWTYLSSVFFMVGNTVSIERWEGTIEYTFMAPVSRLTHLCGSILFALFHGIVRMIIVLIFVSFFFNVDLLNANLGAALVVIAVSSASLLGLGMIGAIFPLLSPEQGGQAIHIFSAMLLMISGSFYPVTVLPIAMQYIAKFSPVTYAIDGVRSALMNGMPLSAIWPDIWPLIIMGIVLVPFGLYLFSLAEMHAKRTGRLKRTG